MPSFFALFSTFLRNDTFFYALNDKINLHFFVIPRFLPYLCKINLARRNPFYQ